MKTIRDYIKQYPVLSFYMIVFAISWGGFLLAVGFTTKMSAVNLPPAALLAMAAGPVVAGIVSIGLVEGKAGFRAFFSRLTRWRVGVRWYATALLLAPLVFAVVLFGLSRASPLFLPGIVTAEDKVAYLLFNLMIALVAGFIEEIGWTGFAVPALRRRHGILATGVIVGLVWGFWHFLGNVAAAETVAGTLPLSVYLPLILFDLLVGGLMPFRVLMVWVYDRTDSLFVAMLMHVSFTASVRILNPVPLTGMSIFTLDLALTIVMWGIVAVFAMANGGHLSRPGKPPVNIGSPQLTPR